MDMVTITAFSFSGVSLLICAWLILVRQKLNIKNKELGNKLILLENNILAMKEKNVVTHSDKKEKITQQKNLNDSPIHNQQELLALRKEIAKVKDEIKKTKEELKNKEKSLKEADLASKNKLFSLTEENSRYIVQLKELDSQLKEALSLQRNQVPLVDFEKKILEISQFKEENSVLKNKFIEAEKNKKILQAKINSLQEKLKITESDLAKWLDAAKTNDGKPLDPAFFMKWHDRALTARKMYKLMRQMRDLSDAKVHSYQEGIATIARWILVQKNISLPHISTGEVLADRLLAEAWNAVMPVVPVAENTQVLETSAQSLPS